MVGGSKPSRPAKEWRKQRQFIEGDMNKIKQFINECTAELKKVVWPDSNERIGATWVVIGSVVFLTLFVYMLDYVYYYIVNRLLS